MINPRMLVVALSAVLLRPTQCSAGRSHSYANDRDETNDHRSLLETVWGHPWYNGVKEETNTDTDLKSGYHSLVGRPGRGYFPVKAQYDDEHSSSEFYHNPYYGDNGKGKRHRPGWGGKEYSKKGMKSSKGGKGKTSKKSKSSKSSGYRPRPPKPHPPLPTLPPGPRPIQSVRTIPNFVISYVDPLVRRAIPTDEDFAELVDATTMWFERAVQATLPRSVNVVQTRSLIARTEYGAGIPLPRFNILVDYESIEMTLLSYTENVEDVPTAAELNAILLSSINEDYIFQVVRQIPAFAAVNEVYAESIENTFDPLPTISPAPTTAPSLYTQSPEPSTLSTPSPSVPVSAQSLAPSLAPSSSLAPLSTPSSTPSLAPSVGNLVVVRVSDFFIAYLINEGMQPTDAEFAQLKNATESWFEFVVSSELPEGVILLGADSDVVTQVYDTQAPAGQPNLFLEYNSVDFQYRVKGGQLPLNENQTLALLQNSIGEEYLDRAVRPIPVFAGAADAFLLSLDEGLPEPTISPGPTTILSPSTVSVLPSISPAASSGEPTIAPVNGGEPTIASTPTFTPATDGGPTIAPTTDGGPTIAPANGVGPTMVPTVLSHTVELNNTYLAFESTQDPLEAPTEAQYQQVINQTIAFWDTILAALPDVGGRYMDTTIEIEFTQLNAAQPMENFNMLIDLASIKVRFEGSSDGLPSRDDLFMTLRDSIQDNQEFVAQSINTVTDSAALVGVDKAVLRKGMLDPPQEQIIPTGDAIVRVESFYLAYVSLEDPLTEPTEEQYAQVVQKTVSYFEKLAANFTDIGGSFLSAVAVLNSTQIAAGIPAQRFNILMNYEYIDLIFAQGTENLPSPPDAFQLLRNSLTGAYLTDYVFTVSNTAFAFVDEFVMRNF